MPTAPEPDRRGEAAGETALVAEIAAEVFPTIRWLFTAGGLIALLVGAWVTRAEADASPWLELKGAGLGAAVAGTWLPLSRRLRAWWLTLGLVAIALLSMSRYGPLSGSAVLLVAAVLIASALLGRRAALLVTALSLAGFTAIGVGAGLGRLQPDAGPLGATWLRTGVVFALLLVVLVVMFNRLVGAVLRLTADGRASLQQARAAEEGFRQLVEASPELIVIHRAGRTLYVNPALRKLVGAGDLAPAFDLFDWVHPDDLAPLRARAAVTGLLEPRHLRLRRSDGEFIEVEFVAADVAYEGAPARVAIGRDITERNAVLARLTLSDRLASLGTLAAGVAHELNNPLAFVRANLEFVAAELRRAGAARQDPEAAADLLTAVEEAREGTDRIRGIVRDLRTLTRAESDEVGPVDPRRALEWAAGLAAPLLRGRALLEKDVAAGLEFEGSEARLGQVLLNLIVNAAQAIPPGEPERHKVSVTGRREGERVVLSVSDTGPGMTPEVRKRAFEPFFTTKPSGGGTGLGLWVCHNLVLQMGGEISVESEPGRGARFRIAVKAAGRPAGFDPPILPC